jgi:hypothetical protein
MLSATKGGFNPKPIQTFGIDNDTPRRDMSGLTTGFPPMRLGFVRPFRWRGDIHSATIRLRSSRRRELFDDDDDIIGTHETNLHYVPRPSSNPCYSIQDNDGGIWYRLEEEHRAG